MKTFKPTNKNVIYFFEKKRQRFYLMNLSNYLWHSTLSYEKCDPNGLQLTDWG